MMDEITATFIEEVSALLIQMEEDLIVLEKNPHSQDTINNVFRIMHTLKGSAGMCGYKNIQDLTHEFEGLYEKIREGTITADPSLIDLTLEGKDLIMSMLKGNSVSVESVTGQIQYKLNRLKDSSNAETPSNEKINENNRFLIIFSPDKTVFQRGLNPDKTIGEIRSIGNSFELTHEKKIKWEEQKKAKTCSTKWEIYLNTLHTTADVEDVFLFYNQHEYAIYDISSPKAISDTKVKSALKNIYHSKIETHKHLLENLNKIGNLIPANFEENEDSLLPDTVTGQAETKNDAESAINVPSHKLDELMNLVSELVTLTATLCVHTVEYKDTRLQNTVENIEKLTKKFRNNALDLRLVPVGTLLSRFKRQVRDLSRQLGKKVNLLIEGQDIEIDKTILKAIESPLQHIVRNSIDHGLEPEEERLSKGKLAEGLLKITAFHSGANVIIQIQDDGRGINLERVRECAVKKGLVQADQLLSKQELINLILEPGFTTSENVSMVSGRGVGMDVVRKELSGVGGGLDIFTEKELGTSIIMKLPTTLTIIDTLMIEVAGTSLLIPIMDIEYCFKELRSNLFSKDNQYIQYKNAPIPLVSLRRQFNYPGHDLEELMVIVINKFDHRYAIVADHITGEHQAVIKPLGDLFMNQPYFSGGSIMSDGKLALILDTNFLFNHASGIIN